MADERIPVNIITGFLGVGKTTTILDLLANRPGEERWAVLVNEFGKVPIDQAALRAVGEDGMQIAEVSGGCLCCTAGVDTKIAMRRLLEEASADRILIEPTGLGHPDRIREVVFEGTFDDALRPAASICLVDPRQCINPRIGNILSYWEQVKMADVIVINKTDLVDRDIVEACREKLEKNFAGRFQIIEAQQGRISPDWLECTHFSPTVLYDFERDHPQDHHGHDKEKIVEVLNGKGQRIESSGLDNFACGWIFDKDLVFSHEMLSGFLAGVQEPDHRIKAVIHTDRGWWLYNAVGTESSWDSASPSGDSRLEHIRPTAPDDWTGYQDRLLETILERSS